MRLENYKIKIPLKVKRIIEALNNSGYEAYIVGGCVRDMLLGETPNDYDICTSALPEETLDVMKRNFITTSTIGIDFGTVEAYIGEDSFEITTFRSESDYKDGRHPSKVNYEKSVVKDLSRRDFTINAMALNIDTLEVIDPFNGKEDIKNKILRAVGNPDTRIEEDAIRMLRAIRFSIRFNYTIEDSLKESIHKHCSLLNKLSKERITNELTKTLSLNKKISEQFIEFSDLISEIIPPIKKCIGFNQNNKYHKHNVYEHMLAVTDNCNTTNYIVKLAALLHDIGKPDTYVVDDLGHGHFYGHPDVSARITEDLVRKNLRLTVGEMEKVILLVKYHDLETFLSRKNVRKILHKIGEENFNDWLVLKQADIDDHVYPSENSRYIKDISSMKDIYSEILAEQDCFNLKKLEVNGRDLIQRLQIKQGKIVGIILNLLLEEVINEEISNIKEELLSEAERLYDKNKVLWTNQIKHKN